MWNRCFRSPMKKYTHEEYNQTHVPRPFVASSTMLERFVVYMRRIEPKFAYYCKQSAQFDPHFRSCFCASNKIELVLYARTMAQLAEVLARHLHSFNSVSWVDITKAPDACQSPPLTLHVEIEFGILHSEVQRDGAFRDSHLLIREIESALPAEMRVKYDASEPTQHLDPSCEKHYWLALPFRSRTVRAGVQELYQITQQFTALRGYALFWIAETDKIMVRVHYALWRNHYRNAPSVYASARSIGQMPLSPSDSFRLDDAAAAAAVLDPLQLSIAKHKSEVGHEEMHRDMEAKLKSQNEPMQEQQKEFGKDDNKYDDKESVDPTRQVQHESRVCVIQPKTAKANLPKVVDPLSIDLVRTPKKPMRIRSPSSNLSPPSCLSPVAAVPTFHQGNDPKGKVSRSMLKPNQTPTSPMHRFVPELQRNSPPS